MKPVLPRGLYAIVDTASLSEGTLLQFALSAIRGGAVMLQYRDKRALSRADRLRRLREAAPLAELCAAESVPFIINDDAVLAAAVEASGVHLGKADISVEKARLVLGSGAIIGKSCYGSLAAARQAERDGADYVAFGSMHRSAVKPAAARPGVLLLHAARARLKIPVTAIGGINADNVGRLAAAGADLVAVISALSETHNVQRAALSIQCQWQNHAIPGHD